MIRIRRSGSRGLTKLDWLTSYHSFSFADYFHPDHMGFGALRVINDDYIAAGAGFPTHGHRNMEIITYVLDGSVAHKDSMGNVTEIPAGDLQRMSAGTGVMHSEFNPSPAAPLRLLQIWITPQVQNVPPSYDQRSFADRLADGQLCLAVSGNPARDVIRIHQDVDLYLARLAEGQAIAHRVKPGRAAWVQVARGTVVVNGHRLDEGDGISLSHEDVVSVAGVALESSPSPDVSPSRAEILLFDLGA